MAEVEVKNKKGRHTPKTAAKKSVRIDLTPMVDLGFLLITFFVFTTTMTKPTVMEIRNPYGTTPDDLLCNSCVLTVIADKGNNLYYYEGDFKNSVLQKTNYNSIRTVIQEKKKRVHLLRPTGDQFVLIIKNADGSLFKNFVDITDEVTINNVKRYYIDELSGEESAKIQEAALR